MTIQEMINEWRKGCSDAPLEHPEDCRACTAALIDAIENQLKRQRALEIADQIITHYQSEFKLAMYTHKPITPFDVNLIQP